MSNYKQSKKYDDYDASGTNFIDVGINEPVELVEVRYGVGTKSGNEYMAFDFRHMTTGATLSHTEYEPKPSPNDNTPENLQSKIDNQIKRIGHIVTKYIDKAQYDAMLERVNSFKEFADGVIALLNGKTEGKKMRLKVVYGSKDFTSLPKYVPFIESVDEVSKDASKLRITSIDRITKRNLETPPETENPFAAQTEPDSKQESAEGEKIPF